MLERNWVGRRVSVRRAVRPPAGEDVAFADVVGDLVALDTGHAVVETSTGLVEVSLDHVAVARLVPPSTRDELALQAVIARGWRPAEAESLGGWTLRASGGFTGRGNSVLPQGPPGLPMDEAIEHVVAWYGARGLPPRFQLPVEGRRLLDADLGERGWEPSTAVHVLVGRLDALPDEPGGELGVDLAVDVLPEPEEAWFDVYRGGAGATPDARGILLRHEQAGFAHVRIGNELVAVGRATIDDDWLGITGIETVPAARRAGHARAVMAALHRWGVERGAIRSHLEVSADNEPAMALYGTLGYHQHHDYRYRTAP